MIALQVKRQDARVELAYLHEKVYRQAGAKKRRADKRKFADDDDDHEKRTIEGDAVGELEAEIVEDTPQGLHRRQQ